MSEDGNSFEDKLRAMARELSQSVERAMEQLDVNDLAGMVGVDPERAREWVDGAGTWLREHADDLQGFGSGPFGNGPFGGGAGGPGPARDPSDPREDPREPAAPAPAPARPPSAADAATFATAAPHPLDLPTEEQGAALAALDSGRWTVEPGTEMLTSRGQGPGPSDALGLVRELRVRDWIAQDGQITRAGRRALDRWLDASAQAH
ncbi:MAG: hypothetical protein QOG59_3553 [Solirubrobacteraceae bacterium]|nr:hypothetical protein [Solirubrobacteraceae bacterium]